MSKPIPLDERIVSVLTIDCTSEAAADVLARAEERLRTLGADADAADVASLSPLATSAEALEHRRRAGDARFESDRMDASVSALRTRVDELQYAERRAAQDADRAAVQGVRDALAAEIAAEYPATVAKLTDLARRIVENDRECRRVGGLDSAEAVGRDMPPNFYRNGAALLRIIDCAPSLIDGSRLAWDAPQGEWIFWGLAADA